MLAMDYKTYGQLARDKVRFNSTALIAGSTSLHCLSTVSLPKRQYDVVSWCFMSASHVNSSISETMKCSLLSASILTIVHRVVHLLTQLWSLH